MTNLVIEQTDQGAKYCRSLNNNRILLHSKLLDYYGFKENDDRSALIFPSGMSAISAIMNICSPNGKTVFIIGDELYCDTKKVCKYQEKYNKEFSFEDVDIRNIERIFELFKKYSTHIKLFFIESCTNPSSQVFDFDKIKELKQIAPNCIFCVDNTWITGYSFNPFHYDIDIVVESMTKYISGGKCIGGCMIGTNTIMNKVSEYLRINGLFVGSDHCQIFLDGLSTLNQRIIYVSELAFQTAKHLESRKEITRVMYPFLESHPTHRLAKKYLKYGPGVIWFHLNSNIKRLSITHKLLANNQYLPFETSFGSEYSKIDQWPELGKSILYNYEDFNNPIKGIWIRLSIGYKSNLDIIIKGINELVETNIKGF